MANTTADKLALLQATKANLKAALAEKGQTMGDVFSTYPAAVRAIETGGGSVTITISSNVADDSHIVYTDPEGNAQTLSNPYPGQTFTALKGSACCVTVTGAKAGTSSQDFPVSEILYFSSERPYVDILVSLATLSASGSIYLDLS